MNRFDIPTKTLANNQGSSKATNNLIIPTFAKPNLNTDLKIQAPSSSSVPVSRFTIPNYTAPNLNTDTKIAQAPAEFGNDWYGAINRFVTNLIKPMQDFVANFKDPTGLDRKQALQENPVDTENLIKTSFSLAHKKQGGQPLTPEQENLLKQGQSAFAKKTNDFVMGFVGGGDAEMADNFANYLAHETNPQIITNELKTLGAPDHVAQIYGDHIARLRTAEEVKNALSQIDFGAGSGVRNLGTTPAKPLEEIATTDWQNNFANEYAKLNDKSTEIINQLKVAKPLEKPALQGELDGIFASQRKLEEDFISKWDNTPASQIPNIESQISKPEALQNELESLKYNGSLEGQYQRFKKIFPHFQNLEDGAQFLDKVNSGTSKYVGEVDKSILYSQDHNLNEVFDEFVKRYQTEKQIADELKIATQTAKPYLSAIDKPEISGVLGKESLLSKGADTLLQVPPDEKLSLKPIIDQTTKTVKDKVHLMDYFQTPEFVLKKLGLEKESNLLHDGYYKYRTQVKEEIGKIIDWKNELKNIPNASENVFKYLDGQRITLTEKERTVAEQMRQYLAEWADKLNLPKDRRIASYITHLFDEDFLKKEFDPELAKLITDKVAGSVYDPFLEKRLGMMGYKQDVFGALDAYVKRATRKVNMDPALGALKKASQTLDVESEKYLMRLTNRINLRPTEIDNLVDNLFKSVFGYKFGVRPVSRISNNIRQMVYRGTLGLNLGSALRNLTQGSNTYAKLGEKYTLIGYSKLFSRLVTKNLDELFEKGILDDALVQDRKVGVYKSLLQKIDPVLFKFFDLAEKVNRGAAYFGAKSKALAQGKTEEEAVNIARALVRETQFAFGNLDSPVILSSDFAKSILQLQTYNVKQIEFLKNMVKNKEFGGLLRYIGASLAMVYTIGRLFGMKPSDMIPTVRIGGTPSGNFLSGLADLLSSNSQTKAAAPQKIGTAVLTTLIPGFAQIKKTVGGINTVNKGKDTTPTGRTRFNVDKTPGNLLRASLFGKSSLPSAQQYYSNIGKKKAPAKAGAGNRFNQ